MRIRNLLSRTPFFLMVLGFASSMSPVFAQVEERPTHSEEGQPGADRPIEEVDFMLDAERLLRHERVIELDRAKLDEVRLDLEKRQSFFDALAEMTTGVILELIEKKEELEGMGEAVDPAERTVLEATVAGLEVEAELFKTQSDVALTAEATIRQQIEALEKKLEREQRAIDTLRGVAPADAAAAPPAVVMPADESPSGLAAPVPGMPAVATTPVISKPTAPPVRPASTVQIEARREVERLQAAVLKAEQAVVEFVKLKESLLEQIELEEILLGTAERSKENLEKALRIRQAQFEKRTREAGSRSELQDLKRRIDGIEDLLDESTVEIESRNGYVSELNDRLEKLQQDEQRVTREVDEREESVKSAQGKLYWLESPLHPKNVWRWIRERAPRILLVIVVVVVLLTLLRLSARPIARVTIRRRRGERALTTNRADTLALSFRSAATLVILIAGVLLVFQEAGLDVKTVLGGAAILGFAFAFGAQNLMRDYFTGFMILLEDQYELGDLVTIENITGSVEKVNMRTTVLRDLEGRVHFIPNGEIKSVTNRSYVWGRAVIEVPIGYKENVDNVMEVLLEVAKELRADPEFGPWITDEPVMLGVDKFTEYGVVIKFMLKTEPGKMFPIRRQMLRRVKNKFDEVGIEISVPYRMILQRKDDHGSQ